MGKWENGKMGGEDQIDTKQIRHIILMSLRTLKIDLGENAKMVSVTGSNARPIIPLA